MITKPAAIAPKTPDGPRPNHRASSSASDTPNTQKLTTLISIGVHTSPAPFSAEEITTPRAYATKPSVAMRSPGVATARTVGSPVKAATTGPAATNTSSVIAAKTNTQYRHASHTDDSARSGRPAPRFWPTSVAAAFARPHAGSSAKITIRIAMVYAATALLPNDAIVRTRTTQLVVAIS